MELTVSRLGRRIRVTMAGELDHHTASVVRSYLEELLKDSAVRELELDMAGLSFMDSSGIGVLLGRYRQLKSRGGSMMLRRVQPSVDRVLQLSGVYKVIHKS